MRKVFFYPPASRLGYENPYSIHYKEALASSFEVCDKENKPSKMLTLTLLKYALIADIFIFNWIESAPFLTFGKIQYLFVRFALSIIKLRKKEIVWMLHNIHPHNGNNKKSQRIQQWLFKESSLVVAHSTDAYNYAKSNSPKKCLFFNHPVQPLTGEISKQTKKTIDVLIWGSILPYKGIHEFLSLPKIQTSNLNIRVIGNCRDPELSKKIDSSCTNNIRFENRRAEFTELSSLIQSSRYVLFPYVGGCVSSSGALIDTLALGGNPVGPNIGAFSDLSKSGLCITYNDYTNLLEILNSEKNISENSKESFFIENSWSKFVEQIVSNL